MEYQEIVAYWWLLPAVAGLSLFLTYGLRQYALAHQLIDIPGERSSHSAPTPRGGGVAILVSFMTVLLLLAVTDLQAWSSASTLLGAGMSVALVGFIDDHKHIAARWRLLAHFVASAWALTSIGGPPSIVVFGSALGSGWGGAGLASIYLVWLLNLYNFMDGIDGIASVEAIFVCVGGALLYWLSGQPGLAVAPLLLAAAVTGFLYWNFPPARIFMGDAGSGFLGFTLAVMSLQAGWVSPALFWAWVILLGVFVVDATLTLLRRLVSGEKVYEAHRTHAYQYAARRFGRHLPVTLFVAAINLCWLLPIAVLVAGGVVEGMLGVLVAYTPLIVLALLLGAGKAERSNTSI